MLMRKSATVVCNLRNTLRSLRCFLQSVWGHIQSVGLLAATHAATLMYMSGRHSMVADSNTSSKMSEEGRERSTDREMADEPRHRERSADRDEPRSERQGANRGAADEQPFKAFVGGLSDRFNDADLKKAFRDYGVVEAVVQMDKFTGRSRGFGFVIFEDEAGLLKAIQEVHDSLLDDRKVSVRRAVPQNQCRPGQPIGRRDDRGSDRYGDRRSGRYGGDRYDSRDRGYDRYDRDRYDRGRYDDRGGYDSRCARQRYGKPVVCLQLCAPQPSTFISYRTFKGHISHTFA